jgi:hypothetical protein
VTTRRRGGRRGHLPGPAQRPGCRDGQQRRDEAAEYAADQERDAMPVGGLEQARQPAPRRRLSEERQDDRRG